MVADDGEIVAGHGRLLAAQHLGLNEVPIIRLSHLTPEQVRAYRIADNQLVRAFRHGMTNCSPPNCTR